MCLLHRQFAHSQQTSCSIRIQKFRFEFRFEIFCYFQITSAIFAMTKFQKKKRNIGFAMISNRMCRNSIGGRWCSDCLPNCNSIIHLRTASEFDDAERAEYCSYCRTTTMPRRFTPSQRFSFFHFAIGWLASPWALLFAIGSEKILHTVHRCATDKWLTSDENMLKDVNSTKVIGFPVRTSLVGVIWILEKRFSFVEFFFSIYFRSHGFASR